jgi:hypothetical protein
MTILFGKKLTRAPALARLVSVATRERKDLDRRTFWWSTDTTAISLSRSRSSRMSCSIGDAGRHGQKDRDCRLGSREKLPKVSLVHLFHKGMFAKATVAGISSGAHRYTILTGSRRHATRCGTPPHAAPGLPLTTAANAAKLSCKSLI